MVYVRACGGLVFVVSSGIDRMRYGLRAFEAGKSRSSFLGLPHTNKVSLRRQPLAIVTPLNIPGGSTRHLREVLAINSGQNTCRSWPRIQALFDFEYIYIK